jgi:predicted nucleic acid-binding protein
VILVDTNVWSELTKRSPEPRVIAWLAQNQAELHLSVLAIAEIRAGCEAPGARQIRAMLELWLSDLEAEYAERIEVFDARDAHIFGQLAAQRTLGRTFLDVQMAAQALARDCVLATRNVRDIGWTGAKLANPWEE